MAEVPGRREQRPDFFLAEDQGKLFLVPRQRNPIDLDLSVQCDGVKETQPALNYDEYSQLEASLRTVYELLITGHIDKSLRQQSEV